MGRRGTQKRGKKRKQKDNSYTSTAEPAAQQPEFPAKKRRKKSTRSIEGRIRRAQSEVQKGIARQAQGPTDPYFAAISAATPTADAVTLDSESSSSESTQPDWDPDSPNNNDQDPSTEAEHYKNQKQHSVQPGRLQVKSLALDHKAHDGPGVAQWTTYSNGANWL